MLWGNRLQLFDISLTPFPLRGLLCKDYKARALGQKEIKIYGKVRSKTAGHVGSKTAGHMGNKMSGHKGNKEPGYKDE